MNDPAVGPSPGLQVRPANIFELARTLRADATRFRARTTAIAAHFGDPDGGGARPWAADSRNEPAHPIVEFHDESMRAGLRTLRDYATAMERLATMAERVAAAYRDQDRVNAADVDDVTGLLGLTATEL